MSYFTDIENKPDDWLVLDPLTIQKPIPKTGCDTNLIVLNYLSEFKTDALKLKVKDNLGLFVDNILSKNSNNPISNKVVYEEFDKLKSNVGLNTIDWLDDSDMNDYVEEGTYNIKGKKTRQDDNLPIINTGDVNARLTVIVTESDNNIVVTLILNLNNNADGEGNIYIRSYQNGLWKQWGKLQTNVEVGQIPEQCLEVLIDNGIYSGVISYNAGTTNAVIKYNNAYFYHAKTNKVGDTYTFIFSYHSGNPNMNGCSLSYSSSISNPAGTESPTQIQLSSSTGDQLLTSGFEAYNNLNNRVLPLLTTGSDLAITFVLITVNGYAVASQAGVPTQCTQLLYGVSVGGTVVVKKRIGTKTNDTWSFNVWEDLGGQISKATNTTLGGVKVYEIQGKVSSGPSGAEYSVNIRPEGTLYTTVDHADETHEGVVYVDSSVKPQSKNPVSGKAVAEAIANIDCVIKVVWSNDSTPLSNMNDFTTAGVYELSGEHTRNNDNLPIANTGSGHTFNARLTVLDSSISGSGNTDDKCITQLLAFSNRLGQGEVYIRTGKGMTLDSLTWDAWSTLQRNVHVGSLSYYTLDQNDDTGNPLNTLIDNGIYNGVLNHAWGGTDTRANTETFILIVINDYFTNPYKRHVSQFKYSVLKNIGTVIFEYRVGVGNDTITWSDWENLVGDYTLPIATLDTLGGIIANKSQSDTPLGTEYGVQVFDDGKAYVLIPYPEDVVAKGNTNAVSSGAVYDAINSAINSGGGDITATPTEEVIEEIEPTLVSTAIRKTQQVLTDTEKEIARGNIGAVGYSDLSNAIATAITNTINTPV